jgi:hypothetical protein
MKIFCTKEQFRELVMYYYNKYNNNLILVTAILEGDMQALYSDKLSLTRE